MAKADYERAKELYPSTSMGVEEWIKVFDANEDIMWSIIGDIYDAVKTEEEKAAGIRRMGRRPARMGTSMDEVMQTVFPQRYSMDPFPLAFEKLVMGRSQRRLARQIPCSQSLVSRLLSGIASPDLTMMLRISEVCGVPPHYFVEYRAQYIGEVITKVLTERPNMGVTAMKRMNAGGRDGRR